MKKVFIVLFLLTGLLYAYPVFADNTSLVFPSIGVTDGSSYANMAAQDSNWNSWAAGTSYESFQFNSLQLPKIPNNAIVDGINYQMRIKTSSSGWTWFTDYKIGGVEYTMGKTPNLCRFNSSDYWVTENLTSTDCVFYSHPIVGSDLNNGAVDFIFYQSSGSKSTDIDWFTISISYHVNGASITLTSSTVSTGSAVLNITGDVATQGASLKCVISLFSKCSRAGYASNNSSSSIAQIQFDSDNPLSSSEQIANNLYSAGGNLAVYGTWSALVNVDLQNGWTCTYPASYYCTHQSCSTYLINGIPHTTCSDASIVAQKQGIDPSADYYDALYALGSVGSATNPDVIPDCGSNPICWAVNKVLTGVQNLFIPTTGISNYNEVKSELMARVPFYYINQALNVDWSPIATYSATMPDFSVPLAGMVAGQPSFSATFVFHGSSLNALQPAAEFIRTLFTTFLYIVFIFFLADLALKVL
jgi:hypothetical protein